MLTTDDILRFYEEGLNPSVLSSIKDIQRVERLEEIKKGTTALILKLDAKGNPTPIEVNIKGVKVDGKDLYITEGSYFAKTFRKQKDGTYSSTSGRDTLPYTLIKSGLPENDMYEQIPLNYIKNGQVFKFIQNK